MFALCRPFRNAGAERQDELSSLHVARLTDTDTRALQIHRMHITPSLNYFSFFGTSFARSAFLSQVVRKLARRTRTHFP